MNMFSFTLLKGPRNREHVGGSTIKGTTWQDALETRYKQLGYTNIKIEQSDIIKVTASYGNQIEKEYYILN